MRVVFIILGGMLLLDLLYWRFGELWLRRAKNRNRRVLLFHRWFIGVQVALFVGFMFLRGADLASSSLTIAPLTGFLYVWHMVVLPVSIAIAPALLVMALLMILFRLKRGPRPKEDLSAVPAGLSRREFLGAAVVLTPPVATLGLTGLAMRQIQDFRVRQLDVALPGLPGGLDGAKIVHVSDLHVGQFTRGAVLGRIVDAANAARADLVVVTGDIIDRSLADLPVALDALRKIEARAGLCMIEGNHDLFDGREGFESGCRASGIPFLTNESRLVEVRGVPVQLLGLQWGTGAAAPHGPSERGDQAIAKSAADLFRLRDPSAFQILLAHHPHAFDPAAEAGIPLTLAGHTHGGQLMLNEQQGFGPMLYRYWSGLYRKGDSAVVVSNGVGNWFPLRIQAPAELIEITLRRA